MNVEIVNVVLIMVSGLEGEITKCHHDNKSFSIFNNTILNKCLSVICHTVCNDKRMLGSAPIDVKITE